MIPMVVSADTIPPGEHSVNYCFTITNLSDFHDFSVFAEYVVKNPDARIVVNQLKPGDCTDVVRYYYLGHKVSDPTFYAIRTASLGSNSDVSDPSSDSRFVKASGWTLNPVATLKDSDKRTSVVDSLKINKLTDSSFTMSYLGQTPAPSNRDGQSVLTRFAWLWYVLVPLVALAGIATVLILRRRRV